MPAARWSCRLCPARSVAEDPKAASAAFEEHYAEHHLTFPPEPTSTERASHA